MKSTLDLKDLPPNLLAQVQVEEVYELRHSRFQLGRDPVKSVLKIKHPMQETQCRFKIKNIYASPLHQDGDCSAGMSIRHRKTACSKALILEPHFAQSGFRSHALQLLRMCWSSRGLPRRFLAPDPANCDCCFTKIFSLCRNLHFHLCFRGQWDAGSVTCT